MITFELKERDAGGRLGKLRIGEETLETPLFLPVVNPNIPIVTTQELQDVFHFTAIMTNAYIIHRTPGLKEKALKDGVHEALGFKGVVFTDSGAYQSFKGHVELTQPEALSFQEDIHTDIGVMLDVPSKDESRDETLAAVLQTAERAKEWQRTRSSNHVAWEGVVQGGAYLNLVRLSCRRIARYEFDIYAVGIPPKLWRGYEFKAIALQGLTAKLNLPVEKPLHAFGVGHPIALPLLVAVGYDIFDSASYSLYARDGRYLTELGTRRLADLEFFPCNCPECQRHEPQDVQGMPPAEAETFLARHNLHSLTRELRLVKQAIHENRLWDLAYQRARAHPKLLEALDAVLKAGHRHFETVDPVAKRSPFTYYGPESRMRPEMTRALRRVKQRLGSRTIPSALKETYPFGQSVSAKPPFRFDEKQYSDLDRCRTIADFQFGTGAGLALLPDETVIEKSRSTGRIRRAWSNTILLATLRPRDGLWVLRIDGAKRLNDWNKDGLHTVVTCNDEDVQRLLSQGRNLFARFVSHADRGLVPGEETLVQAPNGELLAVGRAILSGSEMLRFKHGLAVETREGRFTDQQ